VSRLPCAKVGVILRQTSFLLVPSSDFSMGSSLFTAVRMALATARRHIPVVGSPSRGRLYYHPYDYSRGNFLLRHIDSTALRHWDPTVDGQPLFRLELSEVSKTPAVSICRGYPAPRSGLSCAKFIFSELLTIDFSTGCTVFTAVNTSLIRSSRSTTPRFASRRPGV
jgi:hypothetical protein